MSTTELGAPGKRIRAIHLPSYRWNPYQRLLTSALNEAGIDATAMHEWSRRAPLLGTWWSRGRPEIVHVHWIHHFIGGNRGRPTRRQILWFEWQLRLLKLLGARVVWTVHNLKAHEGRSTRREARAHRYMIERADAVIFHCEAARDGLLELYGASDAARARMHVVAHGSYVREYDVDADPTAARAALGLPAGARVFAFFGSIRAYKGVSELLQAFVTLPELGPEARLLVCGQPWPPRTKKALLADAPDDERITLRLERVPEEELPTILRAADAVVLPFRDILTSGSAILALSHGRPVIAPAMGCLPETIPADASILYDPDAPDGLADALRSAATADLRAMGLRARAYADSIEWGPIAVETARLYRETTGP